MGATKQAALQEQDRIQSGINLAIELGLAEECSIHEEPINLMICSSDEEVAEMIPEDVSVPPGFKDREDMIKAVVDGLSNCGYECVSCRKNADD